VLIGESPILTKHIGRAAPRLITGIICRRYSLARRLSTDLTILKDPQILLLTLGLICDSQRR